MPMIVAKMIVPRKLIILLVLGSSPGQATRVRVSEPNRGAGAMLLRPLRDGHIRSITIRLIGRPAGNGEAYVERAASDHTLARAVAIATSDEPSTRRAVGGTSSPTPAAHLVPGMIKCGSDPCLVSERALVGATGRYRACGCPKLCARPLISRFATGRDPA